MIKQRVAQVIPTTKHYSLYASWWVDEWAPDGSYARRVWYRAAKIKCAGCGWKGKGPAFEKGQPEPAMPDKCPKCGKA